MTANTDKTWFLDHLRRALISLYDPGVLRGSPLVALFGLESRADPSTTLRRTLTDAVESLQPGRNTPTDSRTWRIYQVLRRRYVEQLTQQEVSVDLGLSVRQLQREEKLAREVLADTLWTTYNLAAKAIPASPDLSGGEDPHDPDFDIGDQEDMLAPSRDQELAWLKDSVAPRQVDLASVVEEVLHVLEPLRASVGSKVAFEAEPDLAPLELPAPMLRQALLNVLSVALRHAAQGKLEVRLSCRRETGCDRAVLGIRAHLGTETCQTTDEHDETLDMAGQLIELCRGTLTTDTTCSLSPSGSDTLITSMTAEIDLMMQQRVTVLVIDDNADALQLFRRYLAGTRYHFVGAQDAQMGLELAQKLMPDLVVLDVMMPGRDGWTLLGQLREHPETQHVPVIVCTILAQSELALLLGAAGFIRKPVHRQAFLQALNQQVDARMSSTTPTSG